MGRLNIVLAMLLLLFLLNVQLYNASRPLYEEGELLLNKDVMLQSLQRGDVPSSGASGCTYIPGTGGPGCPAAVKEMHYAGDALPRATAFPHLVFPLGAATKEKY
jgi:hypothetical protein